MFDVIEVDFDTQAVRVLAEDKTMRNADAIIEMAVMRRGVDSSFYITVVANTYVNGDTFKA